jgi:glucose-1-phosphate adenylyltransferase
LPRPKVLALILAGGEGGRLDLLTEERPKPVLPFAGVYRLIDVVLSNCTHSGISDVWVLQQYQAHPLSEHLTNGRPWDLDRTRGGLRIVQPFLGRRESGWYRGNADAIHRNRAAIRAFHPDVLLTLSADHVYRLDYTSVVRAHQESGAEVTMVTTTVERRSAGRFGVVRADGSGRITDYSHKPDDPRSETVATEVFAFSPGPLLELLEGLAQMDDDEPGDLGEEVLPRLVERGRARAFELDGYWRDVGTVESYWEGHMDLLGEDPRLRIDDPAWPLLTATGPRPPAHVHADARIEDSLISPGCVIRGCVVHSVLAPGVSVREGAIVRDSIVLHDSSIDSDASVACAIVDMDVAIGKAAQVGEHDAGAPGSQPSIALLGRKSRVDPGARVQAQEAVGPGDTKTAR